MRAIVVVCLLAVLSLISKTAHADDWNFTPTDYQNLTNGGGELSFSASDADWLPQELKDNLMRQSKHVLRKTRPTRRVLIPKTSITDMWCVRSRAKKSKIDRDKHTRKPRRTMKTSTPN